MGPASARLITATSAVMLAVETIVPAIVGLAALGDRTRPHFEIIACVGFAITVGASLALARYTEPVQLIERRAFPLVIVSGVVLIQPVALRINTHSDDRHRDFDDRAVGLLHVEVNDSRGRTWAD